MESGTVTVTESEEDTVVRLLARVLYLQYCRVKGFAPNRNPYVPAWAIDYARVSVDQLGWDEESVARLGREAS